MPDLQRHKMFRDDSLRLTARFQHSVRDNPHPIHIAAAVRQSNIPSHQFRSHFISGSTVLGTATGLEPQKTQILFML